MPTYGSLEQDRYTFIGINGAEISVKDLPISEKSHFMMWYSRFKVQWQMFKEEFPNGTLQLAYDEETLGDDGELIDNVAHYPSIKWVVDHLMRLAGIPLDNVSLDIVYVLLVDYRGEGHSVFDQIWLNHPKVELPKNSTVELPNLIDQAEHLFAELLRAGYKPDDIKYCLNVMPERELQLALKLVATQQAKGETERTNTSATAKGGNLNPSDDPYVADLMETWYSPEVQERFDNLKAV